MDWKIVAVMGRTGPAGRKWAGPHSQPGVSCPPWALRPWALDLSAVAVERGHALSASASPVARAGSDLPTRRPAGRAREQPPLPLRAQLPLLSLHHSPLASSPDFRSLCLQDAGERLGSVSCMEDMGGDVSFMEDPGDVSFMKNLRMLASWRIWGISASWRIWGGHWLHGGSGGCQLHRGSGGDVSFV